MVLQPPALKQTCGGDMTRMTTYGEKDTTTTFKAFQAPLIYSISVYFLKRFTLFLQLLYHPF
jgi:hypothetical protein